MINGPAPLHSALRLVDNAAIKGREDHYIELEVDVGRILQSWRESLFSFEWLRPDGRFKAPADLPSGDQSKRAEIERRLLEGKSLEKPVLGIGLLDNVEIGAGRAVFLTLATLGYEKLSVHIPKSHQADFAAMVHGAPIPKARKGKPRESGNVMFYILVAIILLAALTYAVSRGGLSSVSFMGQDRQRLVATEIVNYGDLLAKTTTQLRLRGVAFNQLSFAATGLAAAYGTSGTAPASELFNVAGGGVTLKNPPVDSMSTPGPYIFTAANEIEGIGTTCGADTCSDLIMLAGPLVQSVCETLNSIIGLSDASAAPPVVTGLDTTTLFAGTASYSDTIGNDPASSVLLSKTAGCVQTGANYYYYQVLQSR